MYYMCILCVFYYDIIFPYHHIMWPLVIHPVATCHRSTFYHQLIVANQSTQLCPIGIELMSCGWRGWNGLTCEQELQFKNSPCIVHQNLLLPVDCCKTEHSAVFYRHRNSVLLKEKSWWTSLGSHIGISNGHCVVIHCVEKMLAKNRDPMCITKHSSHVLDLVHTWCWGGMYAGVREQTCLPFLQIIFPW
jgi:hypothetical protein